MSLPDSFDPAVTAQLVARIRTLTQAHAPRWGTMTPARMLAHCCILYDQIEGRHDGGPWVIRLLARLFAKRKIVSETPFKENLPTPRAAQIQDDRDFAMEQARLLGLIASVHGRGAAGMEGHVSPVFGPLTAQEWSNLLWKHLDHHLRQFGV